MLYKFMSKGKQINSAIVSTEEEAAKICGLKKEDYDKVETEPNNEGQPTGKKTRQPRSDKGQPRKKLESVSISGGIPEGMKIPKSKTTTSQTTYKEKSRKKPNYFVYSSQVLSKPLTREQALKELGNTIPETPRIIMGHEISFSRTVSLHVK